MSVLGHQYQDILTNAGLPNEKARKLAHAIADVTKAHFIAVAGNIEEVSPQSARTLKFECETFFAD
jgi:hypothetical protein